MNWFSLVAVALALAAADASAILHVSPLGDDTGACGSSAAPCRTLARGVELSDADDVLAVAGGAFDAGNVSVPHTLTVALEANATVTCAAGARAFFVSAGTLRIAGGRVTGCGNSSILAGGVALVQGGAAIELENCTVTDAAATEGGVVALRGDATATLRGVRVERAWASVSGGVVSAEAGAVALEQTAVVNASAAGHGGVVYVSSGTATTTVEHSSFTSLAAAHGSLVSSLSSGAVTVADSTVSESTGSAIYTENGGATAISGSAFADLEALYYAYGAASEPLTVTDSSVRGALSDSGVISSEGTASTVALTNVTVAGTAAAFGVFDDADGDVRIAASNLDGVGGHLWTWLGTYDSVAGEIVNSTVRDVAGTLLNFEDAGYSSATARFDNAQVADVAAAHGSLVYAAAGATVAIVDSTAQGLSSSSWGGAVYVGEGPADVSMSNSTLADVTSTWGTVVYAYEVTDTLAVALSDVTLTNVASSGDGGVMQLEYGTAAADVRLERVVVDGASADDGAIKALQVPAIELTLVDVRVKDLQAELVDVRGCAQADVRVSGLHVVGAQVPRVFNADGDDAGTLDLVVENSSFVDIDGTGKGGILQTRELEEATAVFRDVEVDGLVADYGQFAYAYDIKTDLVLECHNVRVANSVYEDSDAYAGLVYVYHTDGDSWVTWTNATLDNVLAKYGAMARYYEASGTNTLSITDTSLQGVTVENQGLLVASYDTDVVIDVARTHVDADCGGGSLVYASLGDYAYVTVEDTVFAGPFDPNGWWGAVVQLADVADGGSLTVDGVRMPDGLVGGGMSGGLVSVYGAMELDHVTVRNAHVDGVTDVNYGGLLYLAGVAVDDVVVESCSISNAEVVESGSLLYYYGVDADGYSINTDFTIRDTVVVNASSSALMLLYMWISDIEIEGLEMQGVGQVALFTPWYGTMLVADSSFSDFESGIEVDETGELDIVVRDSSFSRGADSALVATTHDDLGTLSVTNVVLNDVAGGAVVVSDSTVGDTLLLENIVADGLAASRGGLLTVSECDMPNGVLVRDVVVRAADGVDGGAVVDVTGPVAGLIDMVNVTLRDSPSTTGSGGVLGVSATGVDGCRVRMRNVTLDDVSVGVNGALAYVTASAGDVEVDVEGLAARGVESGSEGGLLYASSSAGSVFVEMTDVAAQDVRSTNEGTLVYASALADSRVNVSDVALADTYGTIVYGAVQGALDVELRNMSVVRAEKHGLIDHRGMGGGSVVMADVSVVDGVQLLKTGKISAVLVERVAVDGFKDVALDVGDAAGAVQVRDCTLQGPGGGFLSFYGSKSETRLDVQRVLATDMASDEYGGLLRLEGEVPLAVLSGVSARGLDAVDGGAIAYLRNFDGVLELRDVTVADATSGVLSGTGGAHNISLHNVSVSDVGSGPLLNAGADATWVTGSGVDVADVDGGLLSAAGTRVTVQLSDVVAAGGSVVLDVTDGGLLELDATDWTVADATGELLAASGDGTMAVAELTSVTVDNGDGESAVVTVAEGASVEVQGTATAMSNVAAFAWAEAADVQLRLDGVDASSVSEAVVVATEGADVDVQVHGGDMVGAALLHASGESLVWLNVSGLTAEAPPGHFVSIASGSASLVNLVGVDVSEGAGDGVKLSEADVPSVVLADSVLRDLAGASVRTDDSVDAVLLTGVRVEGCGDAAYSTRSTVTVDNSTFVGNQGALLVVGDGGSLAVTGSMFKGNRLPVSVTGSVDVEMDNCTLRDNVGGTVWLDDGVRATLADIFAGNNSADDSDGDGGVLAVSGGSQVNVTRLEAVGNAAVNGGAVALLDDDAVCSDLQFSESALRDNEAAAAGGGVYVQPRLGCPFAGVVAWSGNTAGGYGPDMASSAVGVQPNATLLQTRSTELAPELYVALADAYGQTVTGVGMQTVILMETTEDGYAVSGESAGFGSDASALFSSLVLTGVLGTTTTLRVRAILPEGLEDGSIEAEFLTCAEGWVQSSESSCEECPAGTYSWDPEASECLECPTGAYCAGGTQMVAREDYYPAGGAQFVACPTEGTCLGYGDGCVEGTEGPLCGVCSEGYGMAFGSCRECPAEGTAQFLMCVFFMGVAVVVALVFRHSTKLAKGGPFKIVVGLIHSTTAILSFQLPWPRLLTTVGSALNVVNASIFSIVPLECAGSLGYFEKWALSQCVLPALLLMALVRARGSATAARRESVLWLILLLPGQAGVVTFFRCTSVGDEGRFLNSDYSVDCDGDAYQAAAPVALILTFVYSIGIPLMLLQTLRKHRKQLYSPDMDREMGILYAAYREPCYANEIFIILFKISLWICSALLHDSQLLQSFVGALICLTMFVLHTARMPFQSDWRNALMRAVLLQSLGLSMGGMVLAVERVDIHSDSYQAALFIGNFVTTGLFAFVLAVYMVEFRTRAVKKIRSWAESSSHAILVRARSGSLGQNKVVVMSDLPASSTGVVEGSAEAERKEGEPPPEGRPEGPPEGLPEGPPEGEEGPS